MTLDGLRIADMVKAVREGLGLSSAELAKELKVTKAYLVQVEAGRRYPEIAWKSDFYWKLAQVFGEGWGDPMLFYANLVALDLYERQPEIYLLLARHFIAELKQELGQSFQSRPPRPHVNETIPHSSVAKSKMANT